MESVEKHSGRTSWFLLVVQGQTSEYSASIFNSFKIESPEKQ